MSIDTARGGDVVELELPPRAEVVSVARLVIGALVAADPLFDEERGADLRLAVSEACTNAIQAELATAKAAEAEADGEPQPSRDPILMRCLVADGQIEVTITDHGGGFDPAELLAHPEITDPERLNYEGGLGIPLIKMLSDHLEFVPTDDGMTVVMQFEPRSSEPRSVLDPGPGGSPDSE